MTLNERPDKGSVRAVWSDDFRRDAYDPAHQSPPPPRGPYAPWRERETVNFRMSMDAHDRHELVGLTSMHGMPVLARINEKGVLDDSQYSPPDNWRITDNDKDPQAIYLAKPLKVQELVLTALGGCLNADTAFEPPSPAILKSRPALFNAFSVERWRHRAVLGRDIEVELVYKGFLCPLGLRCSLVKLTERRFLANPSGGHSTAYLVQRMFLRIGNPDKFFPAIGQPSLGRAWPPPRHRYSP